MSKRKSRKKNSPDIPEETLERARQEAGLIPKPQREEVEPDEEDGEIEATAPAVSIPKSESPRHRDLSAQPVKRKAKPRRPQNYQEMSPEDVAYALEHPTKIVSEDALREQYSYVLADLRSMAILAAVLFLALIVIAAVIIR